MTLSQLRSLADKDSSDLILPAAEKPPKASKKHLIEEISSTDEPEASKPVYKMTTKKDADEKPLEIELKIELPGVCSVSECDLSVSKVRQLQIAYYSHPSPLLLPSQTQMSLTCLPASSFQDDILVECLIKYRLRVDLPARVDEEATSATFNKKKGVLIVRMPVYKGN